MVDLARLQIKVDSSDVRTAADNLGGLGTAAKRAGEKLAGLKKQNLNPITKVGEGASARADQLAGAVSKVGTFITQVQSFEFSIEGFATRINEELSQLSSGSVGEFEAIAKAINSVNAEGVAGPIGSAVTEINNLATATKDAVPGTKALAKLVRALKTASSGSGGTINTLGTSLGKVQSSIQPAVTAFTNLAEAARASESALEAINDVKIRSGLTDEIKKSLDGVKADFGAVTKPVEGVVTQLGNLAGQLKDIDGKIGGSAKSVKGVADAFTSIQQVTSLTFAGELSTNLKKVVELINTFADNTRQSVPPVKAFAKFIKTIEKAVGRLPKKLDATADAIAKFNGSIDLSDSQLSEFASLTDKAAGSAERLETSFKELKTATEGVNKKLPGVVRQINKIGQAQDKNKRSSKSFISSLNSIGDRSRVASNFLRQFATGLGLVGGGFATAVAIRESVSAISEYELAAKKAAVVAIRFGVSAKQQAEQFQQLSTQSRELGAATRFTAVEAADAQFFLARAGFEVNEILEATPATLNLAAAGYIDLGEAADIASNVLQQFNLETFQLADVTDSLVATANNSNTSVRQLAQALSYAGPFAASLGLSVDEATAAIGALGNAGIQGSLAGTNLRGILISLVAPSKVAGEEIDKLAARIGKTREGFDVTKVGVREVIKNLRDASQGAANAEREFAKIFQRRNISGALALTKNSEQFLELLDTIEKSAGESARVTAEVDDTLSGAFKRARSAATELALSLGDRGLKDTLRGVVEGLASALRFISDSRSGFENLTESGLKTLRVLKGVGIALSALVAGVTGGVLSAGLAAAAKAIATLGSAALGSSKAIEVLKLSLTGLGLSNPVVLIAGLAAATAAYATNLFGLLDPAEKNLEIQEETSAAYQQIIEDLKRLKDLQAATVSLGEAGEILSRLFERAPGGGAVGSLTSQLQQLDKVIKQIKPVKFDIETGAGVPFAQDLLKAVPTADVIQFAASLDPEAAEGLLRDAIVLRRSLEAATRSDPVLLGVALNPEFTPDPSVLAPAERGVRSALDALLQGILDAPGTTFTPDRLKGIFAPFNTALNQAVDRGDLGLESAQKIRSRISEELVKLADDGAPLRGEILGEGVTAIEQIRASVAQLGAEGGISKALGPTEATIALDKLTAILTSVQSILDKTNRTRGREEILAEERERIEREVAKINEEKLKTLEKENFILQKTQGLEGARLKAAKEQAELEFEIQQAGGDKISDEVKLQLEKKKTAGIDKERQALLEKEQDTADKVLERIQLTLDKKKTENLERQIALGLAQEDTREARVRNSVERELLKIKLTDKKITSETRKELERLFNLVEDQREIGLGLQVQDDLAQQVTELETKLAKLKNTSVEVQEPLNAVEVLQKNGAKATALNIAAVTGYINAIQNLRREIERQTGQNFLDDFLRDTEKLERKLKEATGAVTGYTIAQERNDVIAAAGITLTDDQTKALDEYIKRQREAKQGLDDVNEADRLRQAQQQAAAAVQQDLAGALADVVLSANSAEEALAGFVNQLVRAIAQAQIFKLLNLSGAFSGDTLLGTLLGGQGTSPATAGGGDYKGGVWTGGVRNNSYYRGGIPFLDQLDRIGNTPASFLGRDGSLNTIREGGSSEAILPLGRDGQGRLGVRTIGGGMGQSVNNVTSVSNNVTNVTISGDSKNTAGLNPRQLARLAAKKGR